MLSIATARFFAHTVRQDPNLISARTIARKRARER